MPGSSLPPGTQPQGHLIPLATKAPVLPGTDMHRETNMHTRIVEKSPTTTIIITQKRQQMPPKNSNQAHGRGTSEMTKILQTKRVTGNTLMDKEDNLNWGGGSQMAFQEGTFE